MGNDADMHTGRGETRYSIGELAELTGVSRRTVHFYVQRRLIDRPLGRGRGRHYDDRHVTQIRRVRDLQSWGVTLDDIAAGDVARAAGAASGLAGAARETDEAAEAAMSAGAAAAAPIHAASAPSSARTPRASSPAFAASPQAELPIRAVVRITIDQNVTVEVAEDDATPEFIAELTSEVRSIMQRHRAAAAPESSEGAGEPREEEGS